RHRMPGFLLSEFETRPLDWFTLWMKGAPSSYFSLFAGISSFRQKCCQHLAPCEPMRLIGCMSISGLTAEAVRTGLGENPMGLSWFWIGHCDYSQRLCSLFLTVTF